MTDLIDTTEMYLRTILELEEEQIVPLRARISERLGHSGPTVSQTVGRMERDGLVVVSNDRHLELTDSGRRKAVQVMRKHRLAERLLSDVIGLEWEFVHDEACRWEHVMSERVERKLLSILGDPTESPYGNPIPGLAELGASPAGEFTDGVRNVVDALVAQDAPLQCVLRRLGEPAQVDSHVLLLLKSAGIVPGVRVSIWRNGSFVVIAALGEEGDSERAGAGATAGVELPNDVACHLFVSDV